MQVIEKLIIMMIVISAMAGVLRGLHALAAPTTWNLTTGAIGINTVLRLQEEKQHFGAGFFDQMHLIRDFKVFAGTLPTVVDKELALTPSRLQADLPL